MMPNLSSLKKANVFDSDIFSWPQKQFCSAKTFLFCYQKRKLLPKKEVCRQFFFFNILITWRSQNMCWISIKDTSLRENVKTFLVWNEYFDDCISIFVDMRERVIFLKHAVPIRVKVNVYRKCVCVRPDHNSYMADWGSIFCLLL